MKALKYQHIRRETEVMEKNRILKISIMRYNPEIPTIRPSMKEYTVEEKHGVSLYALLKYIKENIDPSLRFDAVCKTAVCGSCAMMINGKPGLACKTKTCDLSVKTELHPLPYFKLIGDLSVDTGTWFRGMYERTESWIHSSESEQNDVRFSNAMMKEVYELDRCIECGCCAAVCSTAVMDDNFLTAAGLLRAARFMIDPRDKRTDLQWYDVVGTENGMFGCSSYLACNDFCPKEIPLQKTLSMLRRKMISTGMFGREGK